MKAETIQADPNADAGSIIQAACDDVEKIADTFEVHWGAGFLIENCGLFVLSQAHAVTTDFLQAVAEGIPSNVVEKARAVIEIWQRMDRACQDQGHIPGFWEREPPNTPRPIDWAVGDELPF